MKLTLFIISLISSAILLWFLKQEYRPAIVVRTADQFITFLQNGELEKAHELTLKTGAIGKNLADFKINVDREWRLSNSEVERREINHVSSGQTYGNRVRRWLYRRNVDVDQISVDYTIHAKDGGGLMLFEVRFFRTGENTWKISYFQSHAG